MSVITEKSFEYNPPSWVNDPDIDLEHKRILMQEMGMGEDMAYCDAMDLDSRCFLCDKVLETPYIYWHGASGKGDGDAKGISMHENCARHLAKSIIRDADEISSANDQGEMPLEAKENL